MSNILLASVKELRHVLTCYRETLRYRVKSQRQPDWKISIDPVSALRKFASQKRAFSVPEEWIENHGEMSSGHLLKLNGLRMPSRKTLTTCLWSVLVNTGSVLWGPASLDQMTDVITDSSLIVCIDRSVLLDVNNWFRFSFHEDLLTTIMRGFGVDTDTVATSTSPI